MSSQWVRDEVGRLVNAHHHDGPDGVHPDHEANYMACLHSGACQRFVRRLEELLAYETTTETHLASPEELRADGWMPTPGPAGEMRWSPSRGET